jgi:hypothetical protein
MHLQEVVEAQGHLIDSHVMENIFDKVVEHQGRFEVEQFRIGRTNSEPSYLRLKVETPTPALLAHLLEDLLVGGFRRCRRARRGARGKRTFVSTSQQFRAVIGQQLGGDRIPRCDPSNRRRRRFPFYLVTGSEDESLVHPRGCRQDLLSSVTTKGKHG